MGRKRADGEGTYVKETRKIKLKDGTIKEVEIWRYVITVSGKRKAFSATGKGGKAIAKARYDAWKKDREGVTVVIAKDMTVGEWATMWLESTKKDSVTDDWYHELELFRDALPDEFRAKKVCDIAPIEVRTSLINTSKNKSKSYADKMATFLRSMFREASENGLCGTSPAAKLKNLDKMEAPRQVFTYEQAAKVLEYAASYRQESTHKTHKAFGRLIGAAVIVLLTIGLRRGELLGLMWSDLCDDMLTINRAVYMKKDETDGKRRPAVEDYRAKNKSSLRTIPIPEMTAAAINSMPHRGIYIFGSLNGGLMIPRNFNRGYEIFIRDLMNAYPELPKRDPHECRHSFATISLDKGANIKVLQLMLGHIKLETTARYLHPDFEAMKAVQQATWCNNECNNDVKISSDKSK